MWLAHDIRDLDAPSASADLLDDSGGFHHRLASPRRDIQWPRLP
jgi:hypothetical protein